MKLNRSFWIAVILLVIWLVLGWFIGSWLGIKSPAIWYLRIGFWVLGIAGFVGYLLLRPHAESAPLEGEAANTASEIDYNFLEASKRIKQATGNKHLNSLPAIFLLGDPGSAKTTVIAQSGVEAEILAGQAMSDGALAPTRSVNLWFSRNTLFIDPAGAVVADPGARRKLFKKFLPVQLNSLLASKISPTRSVLLTVDCDIFLQSGGATAVAGKAREYQTLLSELSRELGSSFPVYVLFTKADKIPYFRDFVVNLNDQEVADLLGVSLPIGQPVQAGAYSEQQSLRLNNAFQTIYYSLADRRPAYLAREHTAANLPNIYEFPREFAKLKPLLVQFLTDLCRPSQLGTSPFLRGFYFTGIRPVVISDIVSAAQVPQVAEEAGFDSGATRIFNQPARSAPIAEVRQSGSRRIPQWVFLRNLFPAVLLSDRVGTSAAQSNVKVSFARRALMAGIAAASLAMAVWWIVSYRNNADLIHGAAEAAGSVPAVALAPGQLASQDSLERLSKIRGTLAVLNNYARNGAPLSYGAFLYKGNDIREPLRATYYALFRRLLLQPTQQNLIEIATKPENSQAFGYQYVYDVLKAYLITTKFPDKTWGELPSVLTQHWKGDQQIVPLREKLANDNFEFYAGELPISNPYPQYAAPDSLAVQNARVYLRRFAQEDRIYRSMLDAASDKLKPIVFNRDYPGTEDTVRNVFRVEPWFTKTAYTNFQTQLQDPDKYFNGEEWVLGKETAQNFDKAKTVADLRRRYDADFVKTWRAFLAATTEAVPYSNYVRAGTVLEKLGSPQSPLMRLFCVISENTSVPNKDVSQAFQPAQFVAPPGCSRQLVGPAANPYVAGLENLSNALKAIGPAANPNQAAAGAAQSVVQSSLNAETPLSLGFQADPTDPQATVSVKSASLLKDPIDKVYLTLDGIAGALVNGQAGDTCSAIGPLFHKYPFNPASKEDATVLELNQALRNPDGKLWAFAKGPLAPYVQPVGNGYAPASGQPLKISPQFLAFLNRAAAISQALYHADPTGNPNLSFTIQALPSDYVDHVTLAIDGVTLSGDPKTKPIQTFPWPGTAPGFSLQVPYGASAAEASIVNTTGLWAVWHALDKADRGSAGLLQWTLSTASGPVSVKGQPLTVKFSLDPQSAQIFRAQFFAGLNCPAKAVQ